MEIKKDMIKKDLTKKDLIKKDLIKRKHPLVEYSFDELYENPLFLEKNMEEYYKNEIALTLSVSPQIIRTAFNSTSKTFKVIFYHETQINLNKKVLRLLGTDRAIAVNKKGQIVEHARIKPSSNMVGNLINIATTTAYILSAADTQIKLTEIANKIDKIMSFLESDRIGELRGLYNNLRIELSREKSDATQLKFISNELRILSSRFFETAKVKIGYIKDPTQKGIVEKIFTTSNKIDIELKDAIKSVYDDLKAMEFCHILDTFINHELKDNVAKHLSNLIIVNQLISIKDSFPNRIEYIDPDLAMKIRNNICSLKLDSPEAMTNVLIEIGNAEYALPMEENYYERKKRNKGRRS